MGTITSANALRGYFETGDRPTSAQFSDLIESFVHRVSAAGTSQIVSGFGGGAVGTEIFNADTTASARGHLDLTPSTLGFELFEVGTTASAQGHLDLTAGTLGREVFDATTTASGQGHLDTGGLQVANTWKRAQQVSSVNLTDGASIDWALASAQVAVVSLGGNRTMNAPTNLSEGLIVQLSIIQDNTGSRTISWNSVFKWTGGGAPTLSTGASARDNLSFVCNGTNLYEIGRTLNTS